MREQFTVAVPLENRVIGWLYDLHSGVCMGIGSDEQKKKYGYNNPFGTTLAGCPHKVVIHGAVQ